MPYKNVFLSQESLDDIKTRTDNAVFKYSKEYTIEPALIKAFITHESWDYCFAYRVDWYSLNQQSWYSKTLSPEQIGVKKYYASYGLMQILFGVAKYSGYTGDTEGLFDIDTNIKYGSMHIRDLMKTYSNIKDVIHSYNYGSASWYDKDGDKVHDADEPYKNQAYVDSVYSKYKSNGGIK